MKIHQCVQGTSEWRELRLGIPTASQFHRILTPKGVPSKSQDMYLFELIAERIMGEPADPFSSHWTIRGSESEGEAVSFYEFTNDVKTVPVGFITNDAGTIGASPDRLVGDVGLLEIKVPKPAIHIGYWLESGTAYEEHRTQCQGQLWVAEKEWADLVSYCVALPKVVHRVEREEDYLKLMDEHVTAFSQRLESLWAKLVNEGAVSEIQGRAPAPSITDLMKESLIAIQGEK